MRPGRRTHPCAGALATAQLVQAAPAIEIASEEAAALAALAHPLIAGTLSVLAFTRAGLGSLRFTRDLDITGDVCAIKLHGVGHRSCPLYAVPAWARPLLAGARAHHRLTGQPGDSVFAPCWSPRHAICVHTPSVCPPRPDPARRHPCPVSWGAGGPHCAPTTQLRLPFTAATAHGGRARSGGRQSQPPCSAVCRMVNSCRASARFSAGPGVWGGLRRRGSPVRSRARRFG